MSDRLWLATTNRHKVRECAAVLAPLGLAIEVPAGLPPAIEDGETFRDNALLKARSAAAHLGDPALAEDSGLVVPALGGEPGIHSARYAGEGAGDEANNALLAKRLVAAGLHETPAAFVCHLALVAADGAVLAEAEGRVEGLIRLPPAGRGGFGYDPLFFHPPSGCRFSELDLEAKGAVGHRGLALRRLATRLGFAGS